MTKAVKILLVTNSLPLPDSDFLKHKVFGLSDVFDLHLICWDTDANRQSFYNKYGAKLKGKNIHLFYHRLDMPGIIRLSLVNLFRLLFAPHISIPLAAKLIKAYRWDYKKLFVKFTLYYPVCSINPDIVHFEYGTIAQRFSDIKRFTKGKVSVSFRGYDLNYVGLEDMDYYKEVWNNFDGFHFLGNDLKMRAIKRGYKQGRVEALVPPAIDTGFFSPASSKDYNGKLIIVSVGRLVWKKGYEYALLAVAQLKKKNIPFEYRIIGDGSYLQALRFAISELGLENEVTLSGGQSREEIRTALNEADVFLHPAVSEGFCNAVLEAQAMGLPVITTNADGLPENIQDEVTGFIVPIYNAPALADKLLWCNANRDKLGTMGKAGIERVHRHFRIEDQLKKFEVFYRKLNES